MTSDSTPSRLRLLGSPGSTNGWLNGPSQGLRDATWCPCAVVVDLAPICSAEAFLSDQASNRDLFLSHRSTDRPAVQRLAEDVEATPYGNRHLTVWVDKGEIQPGQSVTGTINRGLETSRFIALVMTPDYFTSESGWTDAEWHAALYADPDNRRGRIVPLVLRDCPYIPFLLRHLSLIDFRGNRYEKGLGELRQLLTEDSPARSIAHRGQLIARGGRIDRSTLMAERALPQADPDQVLERLYCNLLPVERLPRWLYTAPVAAALRRRHADGTETLPTKQELRDRLRAAQADAGIEAPRMPAFRILDDRILTFHDLESPESLLASIVDDTDIEIAYADQLVRDEDDRNLVVSLLNMALMRHVQGRGLIIDGTKQGRVFFPPKDGGANSLVWTPVKNRATRTVAKPCSKDGVIAFWRHHAAYLRTILLGAQFYVQVTPTWVFTEDGFRVMTGPAVSSLAVRWTGPERNMHLLYHLRFWTSVLRKGPGPIPVRAGDQRMEVSTVPAFVQLSHGILDDQRRLMDLLDQEAPLMAQEEDEAAEEISQILSEGGRDLVNDFDVAEQGFEPTIPEEDEGAEQEETE